MKTTTNIQKEISNLAQRIDKENQDATFIGVFANPKECGVNIVENNDEDVKKVIADIIVDAYENWDENKETDAHAILAEAIVGAVGMVIRSQKSPVASIAILEELLDAIGKGVTERIDGIINNKKDSFEHCKTCADNRTCNLSYAIEYRKANGIPKPKRKKNGGKK